MRAYLRFPLLGGVIARQIQNLGYSAKAHTALDGEVLQPPLLLLSGLGEVSRIGEVILNPYLGPRLKSGVVTTDMPMAHDKPIDFGLQRFCEACDKCARECSTGAITAGPKCATYRITTEGGAMCGRCIKTCPWNLEGIFAETPFRWAAMNVPAAAPALARLNDALGWGGLNPAKNWWWDLELENDGAYRPTRKPVNRRDLQPGLDLRDEDQTLAVYPANLAPHPWPFPFPMDREKGIEAYQALITADEYRRRAVRGDAPAHRYAVPGDAPVIRVVVSKVEKMAADVTKYEFRDPEGRDLPDWTAGGHPDIVVAPSTCIHTQCRAIRRTQGLPDRSAARGGRARRLGADAPRLRRGAAGLRLEADQPFPAGRDSRADRPDGRRHRGDADDRDGAPAARDRGGVRLALFGQVPRRGGLAARPRRGAVGRPRRAARQRRGDAGGSRCGAGLHARRACLYLRSDRYMAAVIAAAERQGFPEEVRHLEYFSTREQPDYENQAFTLRLVCSNRDVQVPPDRTATEVLAAAGVAVDVKCSDGPCGVCSCGLVSGEVEHRDFVLSKAQRRDRIILCQSRAAKPGGVVELDL